MRAYIHTLILLLYASFGLVSVCYAEISPAEISRDAAVLVAESGIAEPSSAELALIKALSADLVQPDIKFKDIELDADGFFENTSTDGFFAINGLDLPRSQACNLLLELEFKDPMFRPGLFEIFWAVDPGAYSEAQKARFLISHEDTAKPTAFSIPLCKLYTFSGNLSAPHHQRNIVGLRLDYPMNRSIAIKLKRLELLSDAAMLEYQQAKFAEPDSEVGFVVLEPNERMSGTSFRSFDVAIPKVYFAIESGLSRLSNDLPFLVFWLLLIVLLIGLIIRSFPARRN